MSYLIAAILLTFGLYFLCGVLPALLLLTLAFVLVSFKVAFVIGALGALAALACYIHKKSTQE